MNLAISSLTRSITGLDAWRAFIAHRMQPLAIEASSPESFVGRVRMLEFSGMQLWDIQTSAHCFERTSRTDHIGHPMVSLALQLEGEAGASLNNRTRNLDTGTYSLFDWAAPFGRSFGAQSRIMTIRVPRHSLDVPDHASDRMFGRDSATSEGLGPLIQGVFTGLLSAWPTSTVTPSDAGVLRQSFALLRQLVGHHLNPEYASPSTGRDALALQMQRYMLDNLGDPELTPQSVADAHFISLRHLHNVFDSGEETVAAWIRRRRLHRIRDALCDPLRDDAPVQEIAATWGIPSMSTLSRAFKREFGCAPVEYRARRGIQPSPR